MLHLSYSKRSDPQCTLISGSITLGCCTSTASAVVLSVCKISLAIPSCFTSRSVKALMRFFQVGVLLCSSLWSHTVITSLGKLGESFISVSLEWLMPRVVPRCKMAALLSFWRYPEISEMSPLSMRQTRGWVYCHWWVFTICCVYGSLCWLSAGSKDAMVWVATSSVQVFLVFCKNKHIWVYIYMKQYLHVTKVLEKTGGWFNPRWLSQLQGERWAGLID